MVDFQIGRSGFLTLLTREGQIYTWGNNDSGQLGQRDQIQRQTPHRVEALEGKRVTSISAGNEYVIALGLTLPLKDLENLNMKSQKRRSASREKTGNSKAVNMHTIPKQNDYDTVNSSNERP